MKTHRIASHKVLWWTIIIVFAIVLIKGNQVIDIQMHDTYYVTSGFHVGIFMSMILGLFGGVYWLVRKKKLIAWMTMFHIAVVVIAILGGLIYLLNWVVINEVYYRNYFNIEFEGSHKTLFIVGVLVFSQLVFLLNLIISLVRNEQR